MAPKKRVPPKTESAKQRPLEINLALQGGGAHGAFTWGVLDRLLEEEDITIKAISGTSAGAMNAAVLIDGYNQGGRAQAKAQLREFWHEISVVAGSLSPLGQQAPSEAISHIPGMDWIAALNPFDMITRVFSPYEYNPMNYNPLRNVLERILDVDKLHDGIDLFVTATNVETGEAWVFRDGEITIDVLLASACLPFVYQAIEIDGVPYWDGGYMGNPAIWPLIYKSGCTDVMLVQINPIKRAGTPKHALDIINRVNEISFNSSLIAEMRAIHFVQKLIDSGQLSDKQYANMRMHRVLPPPDLHEMNASSKMNANWDFFVLLHSVGRQQMNEWLKQNKHYLGKKSTLDIKEDFLAKTGISSKQKANQ
jgi:NTE family protein